MERCRETLEKEDPELLAYFDEVTEKVKGFTIGTPLTGSATNVPSTAKDIHEMVVAYNSPQEWRHQIQVGVRAIARDGTEGVVIHRDNTTVGLSVSPNVAVAVSISDIVKVIHE